MASQKCLDYICITHIFSQEAFYLIILFRIIMDANRNISQYTVLYVSRDTSYLGKINALQSSSSRKKISIFLSVQGRYHAGIDQDKMVGATDDAQEKLHGRYHLSNLPWYNILSLAWVHTEETGVYIRIQSWI